MKKFILTAAFFALVPAIRVFAQSDTGKVKIYTADSLTSGNAKDVLTSFYQLAFGNLTGPDKSFSFASNPFAIMVRMDSNYLVDKNYYKYRHWRNLNFNFNLNLDSAYHLTGLTTGAKYAILDKRDVTVSPKFRDSVVAKNKGFLTPAFVLLSQYHAILNGTNRKVADRYYDQFQKFRVEKYFNGKDSVSFAFNNFDQDIQDSIKAFLSRTGNKDILDKFNDDPGICFGAMGKQQYDDIFLAFQRKPLWTVAADTKFTGNNFSVAHFSSEFLVGLSNAKRNTDLELDIRVSDADSVVGSTAYNMFTFEPGVNFVVKDQKQHRSFFEFKLSGSYNHIFSGLAAGQKADVSTINGVFRVRVYNNIWIPVSVKYDVQNANFLGFLSVVTNFSGIKSLLGSSK